MSEFEPNQNLDDEVLRPEEKETRGIFLAKEITALRKEGSEEASQAAIAKAQELEILFAAPTESAKEPELYSATELMLEDGSRVLVKTEKLSFEKDGKAVNLFSGNVFKLSGDRVRFKGLVDSSDPNTENHGKPVIEIDIEAEGGLHRIVESAAIIAEGEDFWPFEKLTQEEVEKQYLAQIETLQAAGIIEPLQSGQEGIKGIDNKGYVIPALETIMAQIAEKQEILAPKIEQGFTKLVLIPFAKDLGALIDGAKSRILEHKRTGKLLGANGDALDLDTSNPMYAWDRYRNADKLGGELVYDVNEYSANHGGKTKTQILSESSSTPGWQIMLVEDVPDIPRKDSPNTKTLGGRKQLEAGKSPNEYLTIQKSDPDYANETYHTPESWLAYFIAHLEATNKVIDDYQGGGSVRYLGNAYFSSSGGVPSGFWGRGLQQAVLDRDRPGAVVDNCGVGSAVRIS